MPTKKKVLFNFDSGFDSDFARVHAPQSFTREPPGYLPVLLEASKAALQKASRQYLRLHSCISIDLVLANSFDASASVLNAAIQFVLGNLLYNFRPLKSSKALCKANFLPET